MTNHSARLWFAAVLATLACTPGDDPAIYLEAFPVEEYEIAEVQGVGKFYVDDNPAQVKRTLRRGQPWEPHTIELLEKHIVRGSTVVDVGAHIGSLTVPMARLVGPSGQVYAFEPQKKIHRELFHNLRLNGLTNTQPLRIALGSGFGEVEMDPVESAEGKLRDGQVRIGRGGDKVELRPLDSFELENVSLVKIDVEGFQLEVLQGAAETIERWKPAILIEVGKTNRAETFTLLSKHGYTWTGDGFDFLALPDAEIESSMENSDFE